MDDHKLLRAILAGVSLATMSGCFSYLPTDLTTISAGEHMRVELNRRAWTELMVASEDSLPLQLDRLVHGTLSRRDGDHLFLRVPVTVRREEYLRAPFGQDVRITVSDVSRVDSRRLDGFKTALTVAGAAGFAAFIISSVMSGSDVGYLPPRAGEPDNASMPAAGSRLR